MHRYIRHALTLLLLGTLSQAHAATVHVVKRGDTLWRISQQYHISIEQIRKLNGIRGDVIRAGQKLKLSGATATVTVPRNPPLPFAVALSTKKILGVPVYAVHINLAHPRVTIKPLLPQVGLGRGGERLRYLAQQPNLVAAINGGYFHPLSYSPAGDLVFQGRQLAYGRIQTALSITRDNRARIHAQTTSWKGYETVIATGPHVVRKGQLVVQPRAEGYRDAAVWLRAKRSAVGLVNDEYLIFMSSPVPLTLSEVGKIMQKMHAKEVILLDGGSSTGMVWERKTIVTPARALAFGIGVFVKGTS